MGKLKYLFILLLFLPSFALADTHNAASCSSADITSAITASATGDTVTVPSGTCNWTGSVRIPNNKKLTLQGSGVGVTIISRGSGTSYSLALGLSGSRITGFTFNNVPVFYNGSGFRIDHNYFNGFSSEIRADEGIDIAYTLPQGVIDNNTFLDSGVIAFGGAVLNHTDWTLPLNLGKGDGAIYVEDNVFNRETSTTINCIDANYGGAYVFRYNTVNGLYYEAHSVQGGNRATKRWEVYGNLQRPIPGLANFYASRFRGGTGVKFFNRIEGNWNNWYIGLDNVRSYTSREPFGICDGSHVGVDGNEDATGYPCRDQIGRGPDATLWNGTNGTYTQPLEPAYFFANIGDSGSVSVDVINSSSDHIKPNRDYYAQGASFTGATGVGCGTLVARPATCTTGVAYWATDQSCTDMTGMVGVNPSTPISGSLYKCTATDTWTESYTPLVYPHPLREESGGDTTAPTLVSATINAAGTGLYLVFTEPVTVNTNTGFVLTATGSPSLTYASGTGTSTLIYAIGAAVPQSEAGIILAYTTGANYIEDAAGNDLGSFTGTAVVNNSTQNTPPTVELTVTKTGSGCTVTSVPTRVNCGSTCTVSVDSGTVVTLSGWSENGWNAITYGGDCASNGTVTMSSAKECTATCTQVYLFP
jgi:hypothetical protein